MKTSTLAILLVGGGAAALAAAVLYKKSSEPAAPQQGPQPSPVPGLPGVVPPSIPGLPQPSNSGPAWKPPAGSNVVYVSTDTQVSLRKDQYYRGRISAAGLPPFDAFANDQTLKQGLAALGFADVRVWTDPKTLPQPWPAETTTQPQATTRWFEGKWTGMTGTVPKPPQVESIWMTPSPALAAQYAAQAATKTSGMTG